MDVPVRDSTDSPTRRTRPKTIVPVLVLVLIFIALLGSRSPLVTTAFRGSELTTDEPDLTLMALDRYFGAPMANTHWPAVTNQMLMVPVIGIDFLKSGSSRTVAGFAQYAGSMYRDAAPLVGVHRGLIVLLTTATTLCLAWSLRRGGVVTMVVGALLLQNLHLITYGTLGLGNGPALAAMIGCVAVAWSGFRASSRALLLGVLFGLALASRNTSILFAPLLAGLAWPLAATPRERLRVLGLMAVGMVAGSSPAWALALLEPVRWLKANLGNFVKVGSPVGLLAALRVLMSAAGIGMWIATFVALGWLMTRRRSLPLVIGWAVAFLAAIVISARSPLVETRYFDAIVLGAAVLCIVAAGDFLSSETSEGRGWRRSAGALVVALLLAGVGVWRSIVLFDTSRAGLRPEERAVAASIRPATGVTIVDRLLLQPLRPRTSAASLAWLADQTERALREGTALMEFVTRFKLPREVAGVFVGDLTEKEEGDIVRNRVARLAPPEGEPIELIACGDSNSAQRYGVLSTSAAVAMLREGRAEQAILAADSAAALDLAGLRVEPIASGKYVRIRR